MSYEVRGCFFSYNATQQLHIRTVPVDKLNNEIFMTWNDPESVSLMRFKRRLEIYILKPQTLCSFQNKQPV